MILSDKQIKNLNAHIEKNGKLLSVYELQSIEGFDLETIYRILPFMTVNNTVMNIDAGSLWKRILNEENNSVILRSERILEDQKGYNPVPKEDGTLPSHYLGDPWKFYLRYRVSHKNDFSLGFLAEKDKGEQLIWDPETKRYGMDFYSFHFQTYNKGRFKRIAIGDYQIQEGQSLIFAGGFLIGKGTETINSVRRTSVGIRPYTSAIEGGFFRGAAATYKVNNRIDLTVMGSRIKVDAKDINAEDTLVDLGDFSISLSSLNAGNHRTQTELDKKHNATKYDVGTNLKYLSKDKKLQIGISALQTSFSDSVKPSSSLYNYHAFEGKSNFIYGGNYSYNWRNFNFFGEIAQSGSGGVGAVQGVMASLSQKLQFAMHLRNYAKNFHSFNGDPFAESTNRNEKGVYWGAKYKFNNKWELSLYYDKFKFPWLRSSVDQPSFGDEYLARLYYKPKRNIAIYFQHKNETKLRNQTDNISVIDYVVPTTKQTQIFNIDYKASKKISLKSRVQWSYHKQEFDEQKTTGYMLFQDINFKFRKFRLSGRYAIFDAEGSNNRQYTYEKDVLYAYSIFSFSGVGVRKFILLRYTPIKKIDFWVKLSRTTFDYIPGYAISAGSLEEIQSNKRTDLRLQMRYKF